VRVLSSREGDMMPLLEMRGRIRLDKFWVIASSGRYLVFLCSFCHLSGFPPHGVLESLELFQHGSCPRI
jgi:hypothetical protein